MAVLNIVKLGSSVLRKPAKEVEKVTKRINKLTKDMLETMYTSDGVGLAGPQVGVGLRLIVIDVGEGPLILINPKISEYNGYMTDVEGCLSLPGVLGYVQRHAEVTVEGLDEKGRPIRVTGTDLLARALQHEIDHLDGVLFIDKAKGVSGLEELQEVSGHKED